MSHPTGAGADHRQVLAPRVAGALRADMEKNERRLLGRFELKTASDSQPEGSFTGHGALFNTLCPTSSWMLPPDWQDKFRPGAFARSLADRKANGGLFPACWQHDLDMPIGAYPVVREEQDGLYVEGQLALKTAKGAEVYELMKIGAVSGLSVQYRPTKAQLDEKAKVREILDVALIEIAPCTVPNMDGARVADVKRMSAEKITKRYLETVLRDAGLSRDEAKALLADGFGALELRDADPSGLVQAVVKLTHRIRKAG